MKRKKAFLICPVRGVDSATQQKWVDQIEAEGYQLHWPSRDTDQSDPVGLQICEANTTAIWQADVVFVVWDGKSQGCLFDLGVAFAYSKPIRVLEVPAIEPGVKSFPAMLHAWADQL